MLLFRAVQQFHQVFPDLVGVLGRVPNSEQVLVPLVVCHHAAGFHRRRGQPLHLVSLADYPAGLGKG